MPDVQFCERGDGQLAVGVGYWQPRQPARNPYPRRPYTLCREHLVELIEADLVRCEVTGPHEIVDARTGADVAPGGVVELDPAQTNLAALVAGGLVRILPAEADATGRAKPAEGKQL